MHFKPIQSLRRRRGLITGAPPSGKAAPGTTLIRRRPRVDFSITGFVYTCLMMFMGLAAVNSQANLLFAVFGLMIGVLLFSWQFGRIILKGLKVERVLPEQSSVGQPAMMEYRFTNTRRWWPCLSVKIAELEGSETFVSQPQAYMLHAAPGATTGVPVRVVPKRRGLQKLGGYQLVTSFPFGFLRRAVRGFTEDSILIYPAIAKVSAELLAKCRAADRGGANMRPRIGGDDEFYGVREFRTGENPRRIYWKRSARTGQLIAKEMFQVSPPRILILVDTYSESQTAQEQIAVERTVAMAASMTTAVMESGLAVSLCAWDGGWKTVAEQRGKRHCREILTVLAGLPMNSKTPPGWLVQRGAGMMREGVTPILFSPHPIKQTLGEFSRSSMISLCSESPEAAGYFQFEPSVDFSTCMPAPQEKQDVAIAK